MCEYVPISTLSKIMLYMLTLTKIIQKNVNITNYNDYIILIFQYSPGNCHNSPIEDNHRNRYIIH